MQRGFALLYLVLMVASITVGIALASGMSGTFAGNRLRSYTAATEMRMHMMRCSETLLMQVRNNTALTGSGSLSIGGGTCTYTISGSSTKTIAMTYTRGNFYERLTLTTTALNPVMSITAVEGS